MTVPARPAVFPPGIPVGIGVDAPGIGSNFIRPGREGV
jgi:hypothetical protein